MAQPINEKRMVAALALVACFLGSASAQRQSPGDQPGIPPALAIAALIEGLDVDPGPQFGSIARRLVAEGPSAAPALARTVRNPNNSTRKRHNAIFVLSKIRPVTPEAAEVFAYVLSQPTFDSRKGDYLGFVAENRITSPTLVRSIAALVSDSRPEIRANALSAAILNGFVDSMPQRALRRLLADSDDRVRLNAVIATSRLQSVEDATAATLGVVARDDRHPDIRRAANQAVARLRR
jgi:HEAT repeat protein